MAISADGFLLVVVSLACLASSILADTLQPVSTSCLDVLKKYPQPDATFATKSLEKKCAELCRSSTGQHIATGQFQHPWNCHSFINCAQDDAWLTFCQKGLEFNEKTKQCDWPFSAKCIAKEQPGLATSTATSITKPASAPIIAPIPQSTCNEPNAAFNIVESFGERSDLCTSGTGSYPAPDCRFYVRCNGTQASIAKCPAGFVFDKNNRRCDWPQKVEGCATLCGGFENPPPTPTAVPIIQATTVPSVSALPLVQLTTPSTTQPPTTTTTTTAKPTTTQPPHDPLCKKISGNFDYPNDCRKYVKCTNWHADLQDCPAGLVFVPAQRGCNWTWMLPEDHKCYKSFDNGSGDCPFYRDTNETQIVASTTTTPKIASKIAY